MKLGLLPQLVHLFKLMTNLFCTGNIQGRGLSWHVFRKCLKSSCQDTCEPSCLKLGLMFNITKLYSLISVWMAIMFTQDHRVAGNQKLVHLFCCKVAWCNSDVRDCWCVREMTEEVLQVWRLWIVWAFALFQFCCCVDLFCVFVKCNTGTVWKNAFGKMQNTIFTIKKETA